MKSVVIHAEGDVRVEERPLPQLQAEDDVLVKVVSSGLCGSDIPRIFAQGAHYYPITLGHEFSGYVESYGTGVTDMQPGDAVACVPLLPCFHCCIDSLEVRKKPGGHWIIRDLMGLDLVGLASL